MRQIILILGFVCNFCLTTVAYTKSTVHQDPQIHLGPRPFFLVNQMQDSPLKSKLKSCEPKTMKPSLFSIGHRGAPLLFPEHTKESYLAAIKMGAGILECDVTFTKDRQLVCRHAQCDLHASTDILSRPDLAKTCRKPFQPYNEATGAKASAECCTSDITLAQFRSLCGKMDGVNEMASSPADFMNGTSQFRTDLYATCGTLMTHKESIALFKSNGVKMTPELKEPMVPMPFEGKYSQQDYAQQLINEYKAAGVAANDVWAQSFQLDDIKYWIRAEPEFARQAVYLDGRYSDEFFDHSKPETWNPSMKELSEMGVKYIGSPTWMLLKTGANKQIVASDYAKAAKKDGLSLIAWTVERSGQISQGGGWYYQTIASAIQNEGDVFRVIDTLAQDVGVENIFSDWPATTTYYANCFNLK